MKTIIIENKVKLINYFTYLTVDVICPRRNIQNMLDITKAIFISKKEITVNYNHCAGQLFKVVIKVKFSNIEKHLKSGSVCSADNKNVYLEMIDINRGGGMFFGTDLNCYENKITGIYEFGNCANYTVPNYATYYTSMSGRTIQLNNTERTDFGKKRYVKNAGTWYSNKKF